MDIFSWILALVFVLVMLTFIVAVRGFKNLGVLEEVLPIESGALPKVSIVFSALNEAESISDALSSLLQLDYPELEIIAINDRSTDKTGAILDVMAAQDARLHVIHIEALPEGWLGKNHALHVGAQQATGKYIVFTDADILFEKSSLRLAVSCCEQQELNHLTLMPSLIAKNYFLQLLLVNFTVAMLMRFKPWLVSSTSNHFMGVGAFNMVNRSTYEMIGGHTELAMTIIDDMMLGKIIKDKGFKSQVLTAKESVRVEWYQNPIAMFKGFQKNTFAAFDFSFRNLAAASLVVLFLRVTPWFFLLFSQGINQLLALATLLLGYSFYYYFLKRAGWSKLALVYVPITVFFELAIWWSACLTVHFNNGINWRGTFYPLNELKQRQYPL